MTLRILSLGAGVQSSTVLLMAVRGELAIDRAIFADTGWEPEPVYRHLEVLELLAADAGIPLDRVSAGNLRDDLLANVAGERDRFASIPVYVTDQAGRAGMLRRQCTREYKVRPVRRRIQEVRAGDRVELLIGISLDESIRMRDSDVGFIDNVYPLVDLGMTRADCLAWMAGYGYARPPKSACIGCPYRDNARWSELGPEDLADAIEVDEAVRHLPRIDGTAYLHRSRKPLAVLDLRTAEERGQLALFGDECEGMCGL